MGRVNRLKVQNSLTKKIIITIASVMITGILIFIGYRIINKNMANLAYDLGEKSKLNKYKDQILTSYEEYISFMDDLKLDKTLSKENFNQNYYLASFQEYDPCSEKKFKEVIDIQAASVIKRLEYIGIKNTILGVSGGLDSTLALLSLCYAYDKYGLDRKGIIGVRLPSNSNSSKTYNNSKS